MSKAHKGSALGIKGIPVPLDGGAYTYMNFNKNLVGSINTVYPNVYHNNIMYNSDDFPGISVKGKHSNGISIDEYIEGSVIPSYLYYNIEMSPRTISFWMKSNTSRVPTMASDRPLILLGGELGNQTDTYLECMITRSDDGRFARAGRVGLTAYVSNTSYHCYIQGIDPLDGNWHFVVIEINKEGRARLWVDDEYADTGSYGADINFGNILRVGHNHIPSLQSETYTGLAGCKFDDLCIRTEHYSTNEILSWYFSDREFYNPYDYSFSV